MPRRHSERHRTERIGWLRAAVLGANDGIVSTASLVVGVAAAHAPRGDVLVAGVAGLVAGAMSMAAGEYVSVSSQADTEKADLARERTELAADKDYEQAELASIYVGRGLDPPLAKQVAERLMAHDALTAHARDELGISDSLSARPVQAAFASAGTFALGAGHAASHRAPGARTELGARRVRSLARVSRGARRPGRAHRRSARDEIGSASHLLGCTRDGVDRWRGRSFRNDRRLTALRAGHRLRFPPGMGVIIDECHHLAAVSFEPALEA